MLSANLPSCCIGFPMSMLVKNSNNIAPTLVAALTTILVLLFSTDIAEGGEGVVPGSEYKIERGGGGEGRGGGLKLSKISLKSGKGGGGLLQLTRQIIGRSEVSFENTSSHSWVMFPGGSVLPCSAGSALGLQPFIIVKKFI